MHSSKLFNEIKKNPLDVARIIDHTNVNPNCMKKDVEKLCKEALKYGFGCVVVLPYYVKLAKKLIKRKAKVCTVVGFPFGIQPTEAKIKEIEKNLKYVDEFDVVINRAAFKNKDYTYVLKDLRQVVKAAQEKIVKVIIETPELTKKEIEEASKTVLRSGASYVKTAVGFKGPTTPGHVRIIKKVVGNKIGIKASGGIRTFDQVIELVKSGATRIGSSKSVEIVKSLKACAKK
jgi:deoxyribose-phosphate aldolase